MPHGPHRHSSFNNGYEEYPYRGNTSVGFNQTHRNPSVVRIDPDKALEKVAPLVRKFRENGSFTFDAYHNLLERMCKVLEIPTYKKNWPQLCLDPGLRSKTTNRSLRGMYKGSQDKKMLYFRSLGDLRAFLAVFYLYLKARNDGFWSEVGDPVSLKKTMPEAKFSKELMQKSKPTQIRGLEKRKLLAEEEL